MLKQLDPFRSQLGRIDRTPGHVAARMRETCHEPVADRVLAARHYDRNGRGRAFCREGRRRPLRDDEIDLLGYKLGRELRQPFGLAATPAVLDGDVLADNVAMLVHAGEKGFLEEAGAGPVYEVADARQL